MIIVDYLIIGGGVAGTTAAELIRKKDERSSIRIVTAEPHQFYSRMMLSKPDFYLKKGPVRSVFIKPKTWYQKHNIQSTLGHGANALDPKKKVVTLNNGQKIGYNKLLLTFGTTARHWDVPGAEKKGVLYLRTLDDAKQVVSEIRTAKRAIIVGGGFIGFEMCHLFEAAKIETTLVLRESYFWEPLLDEASGRMIEAALKQAGIKIMHQSVVDQVLGQHHVEGVKLNSGEIVATDMIVVGIGTECPIEWVAEAGIACHHGILTNEYLETNLPHIWAAGDIAEYKDLILNEHIQFGNWLNAHLHGEVAAMNMLGQRQPVHHATFYTAQAPGVTIAFVGDVRVIENRTVLQRGSPKTNGYTRIIVMDGQIEGATIINRPQDLAPLTKMIEQDTEIRPYIQALTDPDFDLREIAKT